MLYYIPCKSIQLTLINPRTTVQNESPPLTRLLQLHPTQLHTNFQGNAEQGGYMLHPATASTQKHMQAKPRPCDTFQSIRRTHRTSETNRPSVTLLRVPWATPQSFNSPSAHFLPPRVEAVFSEAKSEQT